MKLPTIPILLLCLGAGFLVVNGGTAGLQLKITSSGLNLIKNVALRILRQNLPREFPIPNTFGVGPLDIERIVAKNLNLGNVGFSLRAPNVFVGSTTGAGVRIDARWEFEQDLLFDTLRFGGGISATASRVSISQEIALEKTNDGRPSFGVGACRANIGRLNVNVDLPSIVGVAVNRIVDLFEGRIADLVEDEICPAIRSQLRSQARSLTRSIDMIFPFVFGTRIDLSFLGNPSTAGNSLTTELRGRCFSRGSPEETCGVTAPEVPDVEMTDRMARIYISDFVINSLLCALFEDGRLSHSFNHDEINGLISRALSVQRLGFSIRALKRYLDKIPRSVINLLRLQIVIQATSAPTVDFHESGADVNGPFSVTLNVLRDDNVVFSQAINLRASATAHLLVQADGDISANLTHIDLDIVGRIPGIRVADINALFDAFLPQLLVPALNNVAKSGFEVPGFFSYRVTDTVITHRESVLDVQANFAHD